MLDEKEENIEDGTEDRKELEDQMLLKNRFGGSIQMREIRTDDRHLTKLDFSDGKILAHD